MQSSKLWYEHLYGTLLEMVLVRNPLDPCVLNMGIGGKQCTICVHVDDVRITCKIDEVISSVYAQLKRRYKEVEIVRGPKVAYLGWA